jgi:hypothetical protein
MEDYTPKVSVIEPFGPAIEHTKQVLFRPFDLERWLALGFCAWLASFGSGGGSGGKFEWRENMGDPREFFSRAQEYVLANLAWIGPLVLLGMALGIAFWIMITWLSSRGRFMFLNNVIHNSTEVRRPWSLFREYAHSLFLFRLVLDVIGMLAVGAILAGSALLAIPMWQASGPASLWILLFLIPLFVIAMLAFALVKIFTTDFVLPIMLLRSTYCVPAWQDFKLLLFSNPGRLILYLLFKIALNLAIGAILFLLAVLTCCCAACVMALPYIGTVLLLPIHVFKRAYSLHYLRQYGPAYDVFAPRANPSPETESPMTE